MNELLNWLKPDKEDDEDIEQKANAYESFYRSYFEKDLKRMVLDHILRRDKEANNQEDLMFNKGLLAGLEVIKKHFEEQVNISLSRFDEAGNLEK